MDDYEFEEDTGEAKVDDPTTHWIVKVIDRRLRLYEDRAELMFQFKVKWFNDPQATWLDESSIENDDTGMFCEYITRNRAKMEATCWRQSMTT
jgi:hypothetical protein